MLVRIITSVVGVAVMIPIMWFSDTYVFPVALSALCVIALYEFFSCVKLKGKLFVTVPTYVLGAGMPFLCKYFGDFEKISSMICAIIFVYMIYLIICSVLFHKYCETNDLSTSFLFSLYIIAGFSSIQLLRNLNDGILVVIAVLLAAWMTDIFAYFTGRFLGKHKLCETISPKKTVEGSVGGIIFCVNSFPLYSAVFMNKVMTPTGYLFMMLAGFILSVVSQFGDLAMSVVKRKYGVKDYGHIFPGHGGILDRFDSILAVAPVFLMIILITNAIL